MAAAAARLSPSPRRWSRTNSPYHYGSQLLCEIINYNAAHQQFANNQNQQDRQYQQTPTPPPPPLTRLPPPPLSPISTIGLPAAPPMFPPPPGAAPAAGVCAPYATARTSDAYNNASVACQLAFNPGDTVELSTCASAVGDTLLRLFDPTGAEVAMNDDGCLAAYGSKITYSVPCGAAAAGCWVPPGRIEFDADTLTSSGAWESVAQHEIGHALGLHDVSDGLSR